MRLENIDSSNFKPKDVTMSFGKANLLSLVTVFPLALVGMVSFIAVYGWQPMGKDDFATATLAALLGILVHELLHGAVWARACEFGWKSIKLGIVLKILTPYCHCKEALSVREYRRGTLAPFVFLGFVPFLISIMIGSFSLLYFSMLMIAGAGGDLATVWILRKEKGASLVMDHSKRIGCVVYAQSV